MKKIGILTFHWADNYGAVLQAYALKEYINDQGNDIEIINYVPKVLEKHYVLFRCPFKLIKEYGIFNGLKKLAADIIRFPKRYHYRKNFNRFRTKDLKIGNTITKEHFMHIANTRYSSIIVGSDQVWNPDFTNLEKIYFLDFNFSGLKYSYGASCGIELNKTQITALEEVINRFDLASFREQFTVNQLHPQKRIYNVLDPVFLLEKDKWTVLISGRRKTRIKGAFIFVYDLVINKTIIDTANFLSKKLGFPIVSYSGSKKYIDTIIMNIGPLDFLELIEKAEIVITSSFHGVAFSIIHRKNFYVIKHPTRGVRMLELLEKFNLIDRLVESEITDFKKIDYSLCEDKIEIAIKNSKDFIGRILKKNNEN